MTRTHGLDEARLERIGEHLVTRYVEPGKVAGCQALVARHGQVAYSRSFGLADRERGTPVRDDTIWRIYSMTKPITSVALMSLYERGLLQLTDPVHRYIPEWRDLKVYEPGRPFGDRLVAPQRPPTVRDLLMHTSGLSYGFDPEDRIDQQYAAADVRSDEITLEELTRRLAGLPLRFHPGSRWNYSFATDACARLVEIISGRAFGDYLREVVFDPLDMSETGFVVPEAARDRFAANYYRSEDRTLTLLDDPATSPYIRHRAMQSGGGGLVSTTPDYLRFLEMLRRGGELDGVRILGPRTIRYMASNHLPGGASLATMAQRPLGTEPMAGIGFGLGFAVTLDPVELQSIASAGEYYWGGAAATLFWIDPIEDLIVIFMVQHMQCPYNFRGQLQQLVHQAIVS